MQIEPSRHDILLIGPLVHRMAPIIESCGYRVAARAKGSDALLLLKAKTFHVILFEINLDDLELRTFLQQAKEIQPNSAYLLLDDPAKTGMVVSALVHGVDAYIATPPDETQLYGQIARHALAAFARGGGEIPSEDLRTSQEQMNRELKTLQQTLQEMGEREASLTKENEELKSELAGARQKLQSDRQKEKAVPHDAGAEKEYIKALKDQVSDLKSERTSLIDKLSDHGVDVSDEYSDLIEMIDDDDEVFGGGSDEEAPLPTESKQQTGANVIYLGSGYEDPVSEEIEEDADIVSGAEGSINQSDSDGGKQQANFNAGLADVLSDEDHEMDVISASDSSDEDVLLAATKNTDTEDAENAASDSQDDKSKSEPEQKKKAASAKAVPSAVDFFDDDLDFLANRKEAEIESKEDEVEIVGDDDIRGFLDESATSADSPTLTLGALADNGENSKDEFRVSSQLGNPIRPTNEEAAKIDLKQASLGQKEDALGSWEPATLETGSQVAIQETQRDKDAKASTPTAGLVGEDSNTATLESQSAQTPPTGIAAFSLESSLKENDDNDDATRVAPMMIGSDAQDTPATGLPSFAVQAAIEEQGDSEDATRVAPMMVSSDAQDTPATGLPSFAVQSALEQQDENDDATRVAPMLNSQMSDAAKIKDDEASKSKNKPMPAYTKELGSLGHLSDQSPEGDFDDATSVAPMFSMPNPPSPKPAKKRQAPVVQNPSQPKDTRPEQEFDLNDDDDFADATMVNVAMSEIEAIPDDLDFDIGDNLNSLLDADDD